MAEAAKPKKTRATPFKHVEIVDVHLWGELIGKVTLDSDYGYYVFAYAPDFVGRGIEPSPLHMPATSAEPYLFTDLTDETYKRLPAMLADALPDDFGNALITKWMTDRGISANAVTALDRLAYMGTRAMGALEFHPERGPERRKATPIKLSLLVEDARKAVRGEFGDEDETSAALRSIIEVGTSAGGARAKAVIAWNPTTQEIRSGQMAAPEGFEHWLLKFDGMGKDRELGTPGGYGRIEQAYHIMAGEAGIDMMPCRLLEENGRAHFMTKRFDRAHGLVRHHVQTLCAMDHVDFKRKGTNSYGQLFDVIRRLGLPYKDREEAFRRMAFNAMARNCDDHSKNFGFILRQGQPWRLAPAYDVTHAHSSTGEWTREHLLGINGKFKAFTREDFREVANRFNIGSPDDILDKVGAAVKRWPDIATAPEIRVPDRAVERVSKDLRLL